MNLGITDMIGLALSLIFAIPLGNYALIQLVAGEIGLGVGLLIVAVAMVVLPQYFLDPGRIVRELLAGLLPRQLRFDTTPAEPADAESPARDSSARDSADESVSTSTAEDTSPANK